MGVMQIDFKAAKAKRWIVAAVALGSVAAYCAPPGTFRRIDFDLTGRVLDEDTKAPIEGAYVVGNYLESRSSMAASVFACIKTVGTYSDKSGNYRLPIDKLDAISPQDVTAIKQGYYGNNRVIVPRHIARQQKREAYTNRDIYLRKQDPQNPNFRFGDGQEACIHAESRESVEASIRFLKIEVDELTRLNAEPRRIGNAKEELARLESRPPATNRK